jgi:Pyruvate/2-oxoacid:ferredoxin oxidoreductase gamma subunit
LGSAGQRIVTAGELLCLAAAAAGLNATQKNDYPITVMRGHSVSELIVSGKPIGYTGIQHPTVVVALAAEGVARKRGLLSHLPADALLLRASGVEVPETRCRIRKVDFKAMGLKSADWALASLAVLAGEKRVLSPDMLQAALELRFRGTVLDTAHSVLEKVGTAEFFS